MLTEDELAVINLATEALNLYIALVGVGEKDREEASRYVRALHYKLIARAMARTRQALTLSGRLS